MQNHANQPQNAIVMNYLCQNMVETKRKAWFWCALVLKLEPQACARGQRNTHPENNFDWSRNNSNNTRANYCPWDNSRTDNFLAANQSKNTKILQRIIWQNIKNRWIYLYAVKFSFRGNFFWRRWVSEEAKTFVARRPIAEDSVLPWILPFLEEGLQYLKQLSAKEAFLRPFFFVEQVSFEGETSSNKLLTIKEASRLKII